MTFSDVLNKKKMASVRWPGRSRSRAMSFERFRRCAQDTKAVKLRAMTQLALRP